MVDDAPGACRAVAFCSHCGASSTGGPYCTTCGKPTSSLAANPYVPQAAPSPVALGTPVATAPLARPVGVTLVSVGFFLIAGGLALASFILMILLSVGAGLGATEVFGPFAPVAAFFGAIFLMILLVVLAMGALMGAIGYGLLRGRSWAWVGALVVAGFAILSGLAGLVDGDFGAIIQLALWGGAVFCLLQPEARAFFGKS